MQKTRKVKIGAAAAMMLGALCPWAGALGLVEVSGLAVAFGWVTLLGGAVIALFEVDPIWLRRRAVRLRRYQARTMSMAASLSTLACVPALAGLDGYGHGTADPGWGLFLSLGASLIAVWATRTPGRDDAASGCD